MAGWQYLAITTSIKKVDEGGSVAIFWSDGQIDHGLDDFYPGTDLYEAYQREDTASKLWIFENRARTGTAWKRIVDLGQQGWELVNVVKTQLKPGDTGYELLWVFKKPKKN